MEKTAPNHLKQNLDPKAPNIVWNSDFTYIKAGGKWCYLCIVMDLFSRKIITWNISAKADGDLVNSTFQKAYESRNFPKGLMFHSDRGTQYTAVAFRKFLDTAGNELKLSLFQYIDGFYNPKRPHGSLGLMSPNEKERNYYSSK